MQTVDEFRAENDDPELIYRLEGGFLKRVDRCANQPECDQWAQSGDVYCSQPCRLASARRSDPKHVGGSIESHARDAESRSGERGQREPILGTRNPRSLSRDGSGHA